MIFKIVALPRTLDCLSDKRLTAPPFHGANCRMAETVESPLWPVVLGMAFAVIVYIDLHASEAHSHVPRERFDYAVAPLDFFDAPHKNTCAYDGEMSGTEST
jgi:hypothetical protein